MKPSISVMYLSNRHGGIDILKANLNRQTFEDWELVLVDALWEKREKDVVKYVSDKRLRYVRQNPKPKGAFSNLAHADNQGFSHCRGELIVCLQDYIWIPHNGLEKFWEAHKALEGKALISGVGHQYAQPGKDDIKNEKGKITIFEKPFTGKPEVQGWSDPRMRTDQGTFYETSAINWEMNWAAIPRKVIYELGGMDEEYDFVGFAYDNVSIAQRAELAGYKTYLDQTNECRALKHDDWAMESSKKDRSKEIAQFHVQRIQEIIQGHRPLKVDYLQEGDKMDSKVKP